MGKFRNKKIHFSILAIFAAAFFALSLTDNSAYATFSISVGSNGTVDLGNIMPTPTSGAVSNTGTDNVSVTTNCSAGYNIYATSTNGGSTSLVDSKHNTNIPTSANSIISPAALDNNTWGIAASTAATPTIFAGLPAYTTNFSTISPIYTAPASPESIIRNDNISVYYGIKVNTDTVPGDYTTNVLYTAVMNGACLRYILNFDGNGATENNLVSTAIAYGENVDLSQFSTEDKIKRSGYRLIGWKIKINDAVSETTYSTDANVVLDDGSSSSVTLIAQWEATTHTVTILDDVDCSDTVHPTGTSGCKMADGRTWIFGNNENTTTWDDVFTGATGVDGHDATIKPGICPAGYSAPTIADYDKLVIAYGGNEHRTGSRDGYYEAGAIYGMFGLSRFGNYGTKFWSSTEESEYNKYVLSVSNYGSPSSNTLYSNDKSYNYYILCFKENSIASVSGAGEYSHGETVNISAVPNAGHRFTNWTVNSPSDLTLANSSASTTTFVMPNADVIIAANGESIPRDYYTVEVFDRDGISSTSGSGNYRSGSTVNISATAIKGHRFGKWKVNSGSIDIDDVYSAQNSFVMPANDVSIAAEAFTNWFSFEYNPNDSSTYWPIDGGSAYYDGTITFMENYYSRSGYSFVGWATSPSATTAYYFPGDTVDVSYIADSTGKSDQNGSTIILYAVWKVSGSSQQGPCLETSSGCSLADGRTWRYSIDSSVMGKTQWSNSYTCPDGYYRPNNSVYKSLINAYGGTNGSSSNDRLYKAMQLSAVGTFWSTDTYNSNQAYFMVVSDGGSYIMYNDKSNKIYQLCYK